MQAMSRTDVGADVYGSYRGAPQLYVKCKHYIVKKNLHECNKTCAAKKSWYPLQRATWKHVFIRKIVKSSLPNEHYWKCNVPMSPSVGHNFLKGRKLALPCSYRSTCFFPIQTHLVLPYWLRKIRALEIASKGVQHNWLVFDIINLESK